MGAGASKFEMLHEEALRTCDPPGKRRGQVCVFRQLNTPAQEHLW